MSEMGPGNHDQFDLLIRLGADLPGAIIVTPETAVPSSVGPIDVQNILGVPAPLPEGIVKFSLAGVQLKFAATTDGDRLTAPARAGEGRCILKVPTKKYPGLPEAETRRNDRKQNAWHRHGQVSPYLDEEHLRDK